MRPVILYRPFDMSAAELAAAEKYFPCFPQRTAIQRDDFVVGRYSVLPYFEGIQADCDYAGATLINNIKQHRYLADMRNWIEDLKGLTPKTWYRLEDIDEEGPYVLKGKTNSRKHEWKSHMFAVDRKAAGEVHWRLSTDGLIGSGQQDIYIRKYVPLKTYLIGLNDMPVTEEYRFFCAFEKVLCGAFYWSNYAEDLPEIPNANVVPAGFVEEVLKRIGRNANFVVVDVARDAAGNWLVIELNDGQMSGLSENNPEVLYKELRSVVDVQVCGPKS